MEEKINIKLNDITIVKGEKIGSFSSLLHPTKIIMTQDEKIVNIIFEELALKLNKDKAKKRNSQNAFSLYGFANKNLPQPQMILSVEDRNINIFLGIWEKQKKREDGTRLLAITNINISDEMIAEIKKHPNNTLAITTTIDVALFRIEDMIDKSRRAIRESQEKSSRNKYPAIKENIQELILEENFKELRRKCSVKKNTIEREAFSQITEIEFNKKYPSSSEVEQKISILKERDKEQGILLKKGDKRIVSEDNVLRVSFSSSLNSSTIYVNEKGSKENKILFRMEGKPRDYDEVREQVFEAGWTTSPPPRERKGKKNSINKGKNLFNCQTQ